MAEETLADQSFRLEALTRFLGQFGISALRQMEMSKWFFHHRGFNSLLTRPPASLSAIKEIQGIAVDVHRKLHFAFETVPCEWSPFTNVKDCSGSHDLTHALLQFCDALKRQEEAIYDQHGYPEPDMPELDRKSVLIKLLEVADELERIHARGEIAADAPLLDTGGRRDKNRFTVEDIAFLMLAIKDGLPIAAETLCRLDSAIKSEISKGKLRKLAADHE